MSVLLLFFCGPFLFLPFCSHQLTELLRCEAGVFRNARHGESVNGSVARNGEAHFAIRHHGMFTFSSDTKTNPGKDADCGRVADAGQLGHGSQGNNVLFHFGDAGLFRLDFQPFVDGDLDVLDGFFASRPLRMATGKRRASDRPPFFGLHKANSILH